MLELSDLSSHVYCIAKESQQGLPTPTMAVVRDQVKATFATSHQLILRHEHGSANPNFYE